MRSMTATLALVAMLGSNAAIAQSNDALRRAIDEHLGTEVTADDTASTEVVQPVLFTEGELDELLAPVALYPDALLAQVLVAATFPTQVSDAAQLIEDSDELSEEELAERLRSQEWDPSVLVLTSGFPTVVQRMAEDIDWTTDLGDAMLWQDEDVLASVQRLRSQALETGYLADNEAQVVEQEDDRIVIQPADPEVVYVPSYDPQVAYTSTPTASPYIEQPRSGGGLLSNPLVAGAIGFGGALLVQELFGDGDEDDNDDGWDDYWDRGRPIDWRDRQVYARPRWAWDDDGPRRSWAWERDRYWDPYAGRWRREGVEARRIYDAQRRDTVGWLVLDDPDNNRPRVRAIRYDDDWRDQRARQIARRQAEERREARLEEARRQDRIEARRAEQRREEQLAAERRERRLEAARVEARQERQADERRDLRQQRREQRAEQASREGRQERQAEEQRRQRVEQRREQQAEDARRERRAQEQRQQERGQEARREQRQEQQAEEQREQRREQRQEQQAEEQREQRIEQRREQQAEDAASQRRQQQRAEERRQQQAGEARRQQRQQQRAEPQRRQEAQQQPRARQERARQPQAAEERRARPEAAAPREARQQRAQQQRAGEERRARQEQAAQQQRRQQRAEQEERPRRACRNNQDENCRRN
jgi:hypothetical protein